MQSEMSILRSELHLGYDREDGLGNSLNCLIVAINELRMSVAEKEAMIVMQEEENKSLRAEKDVEIDKLRAENNHLKNSGNCTVNKADTGFDCRCQHSATG